MEVTGILYILMHMREPAFSTSGLKYDITIVFLDPNFMGNSGDSLT